MQVHRDLARAVRELGGADAIAALGSATTNRALHTRLAWELGTSIQRVERVTDHRVVFRSDRELLAGRVYMLGRARRRLTLARVGSIRVYERDGISFPLAPHRLTAISSPFTGSLQGIHTRASGGRNRDIAVVTR